MCNLSMSMSESQTRLFVCFLDLVSLAPNSCLKLQPIVSIVGESVSLIFSSTSSCVFVSIYLFKFLEKLCILWDSSVSFSNVVVVLSLWMLRYRYQCYHYQ